MTDTIQSIRAEVTAAWLDIEIAAGRAGALQQGGEVTETREEFEQRYPRPGSAYPDEYGRVLVACSCDYDDVSHWAWAFWYFDEIDGGLMGYETLAEEEPHA